MAAMRAAKERKRQERIAAGLLEEEPKMVRWYPLQFGVKDKRSGVECWLDLKSVRDAARRVSVLLRFYEPGIPELVYQTKKQ